MSLLFIPVGPTRGLCRFLFRHARDLPLLFMHTCDLCPFFYMHVISVDFVYIHT